MNYYTLKNGQTIINEEHVKLMNKLLELKPHFNFDFQWNDIGLGNLFAECFGDKLRYCVNDSKWYIYENGLWKKDIGNVKTKGLIQTLLQMLNLYIKEVTDEDDEEEVDLMKKYKTYINKASSTPNQNRAIESAENSLVINITNFDSNPYLLNCINGVYNMKTLEFRESKPEDYFTLQTDSPYIKSSPYIKDCDRWYTYIDEITSGNKDKARFLQKALGYSLLGENNKECMFIAFGKTRSGKGTLFNTVANVLGLYNENGYAATINPNFICEKRNGFESDGNVAEPALASTVGKRYLTLSETKHNALLNTNAIKQYTGRDPIKTRGLYKDPITFLPQFTMWLSTNFYPLVNDHTLFESDRVWVITFDEHFDITQRDENLKSEFIKPENKPTILRWLIDGYEMYVKEGLIPPQCVIDATKDYARMNDTVLCFTLDCLEKADNEFTSNTAIYTAYKKWCDDAEREYNYLGSKTFYKNMRRFYSPHVRNGITGFIGVKLKNNVNDIVIK